MIRLIITRKMKEYVWANNVTTCYAKPQGVVNIKYVNFFLLNFSCLFIVKSQTFGSANG